MNPVTQLHDHGIGLLIQLFCVYKTCVYMGVFLDFPDAICSPKGVVSTNGIKSHMFALHILKKLHLKRVLKQLFQ